MIMVLDITVFSPILERIPTMVLSILFAWIIEPSATTACRKTVPKILVGASKRGLV